MLDLKIYKYNCKQDLEYVEVWEYVQLITSQHFNPG